MMFYVSAVLRRVLKNVCNEDLVVMIYSGQYKGYFISYNKDVSKYNFRKYHHGRIVPIELGLSREQAQFKYKILMERQG